MENRENRNTSTDASELNRKTSERRPENLSEGGNMENRKSNMENPRSNMDTEREQSRRPSGDSGFGSSSGRSSGSSSSDSGSIERDDLNKSNVDRSRQEEH